MGLTAKLANLDQAAKTAPKRPEFVAADGDLWSKTTRRHEGQFMQFSLFGGRPLFDQRTLERCQNEWRYDTIPGFNEKKQAIIRFQNEISNTSAKRGKETELEQAFNDAFFVDLLGYTLYPGHNKKWTVWPKPKASELGLTGEPDAVLGISGSDGFEALAVVELKKPGANLDAPQPSYQNRTPVEQAFDYARQIPSCRWVILSNMKLVRLYAVETQDEYHTIYLAPGEAQADELGIAYRLLAETNLIADGGDSSTARILAAVRDAQASFREAFYKIYSDIRADLLNVVEEWSAGSHSRILQVLAVQRLLDRMLFIFFCEHHPDRLLPANFVKDLTASAIRMPGASNTKAYNQLKLLFRDLDVGVQTRLWSVPRYNGELFKPDPIVDQLTITDDFYDKEYRWSDRTHARTVRGIYGLHVFDFWRELDRDLLGNVFERSIGDLAALAHGGRPDARAAFGVFYTATRLARYTAASAVEAMLSNDTRLAGLLERSTKPGIDPQKIVSEVMERLKVYRIADLSCGSGAFLTAALDAMLVPYRKVIEAVQTGSMDRRAMAASQSELLKSVFFGVDILPQAVELAKLSLWLTAARKNEPSADLTKNFIVGDSLEGAADSLAQNAGGKFDLIVGNPPWGGDINSNAVRKVMQAAGCPSEGSCDSWEVFLALAIMNLKPNGRFGVLVPDTLFSPEKERTRAWLLDHVTLEKVFSMGPDWFTSSVRMGTVYLEGVLATPRSSHRISQLVLAGQARIDAQQGRKSLRQLESALTRHSAQRRFRADEARQIQVLASDEDLDLLSRIDAASTRIDLLTSHARGDEINAEGLLWRCGGCMTYTVPGEKTRAAERYLDKKCPMCGAKMTSRDVVPKTLVAETRSGPYKIAYVDGRSLTRRYENPVRRYLRDDLAPLLPRLKDASAYSGPKILIRQAGVGVAATLVYDDSRCPQSVYIYRCSKTSLEQGYTNEFLLACLTSRTMNYVIMMKFGEIDPARAFAKLTHARIGSLPAPTLDTEEKQELARNICANVRAMLERPIYGGALDHEIEFQLRALWGISPDEGRYINGFFSSLPDGQAVRDLFPTGAPSAMPVPKSLCEPMT